MRRPFQPSCLKGHSMWPIFLFKAKRFKLKMSCYPKVIFFILVQFHILLFLCMWDVWKCSCMFVNICAYVCGYMCVRPGQRSLLITLHPEFWDWLSHWTWNVLIVWLSPCPTDSPVSASPAQTLPICYITLVFYLSSRNLNSELYACIMSYLEFLLLL